MPRHKQEILAFDIRSVRMARRVAQRDLAEAVGVKLPELKRWERGLELPNSGTLVKLAGFLHVDAGRLAEAQRRFVEIAT
ncbi:MAG TPA: helix-turn-helix transcriptional regulator, partial [Longimicrobium sp.]|nr:helix-turn-helix transcriptional regulator [Longimicrobium sp.]